MTFGRIQELRALERCERALARAWGRRPEAAHHRKHAALLRRRIEALGGRGSDELDDDWLRAGTLTEAERTSIVTYHDHLTDLDAESAAMIADRILPDHERTLRALDPLRDHQSEV